MRSEHERYYGWGKDALVSVCSWNMDLIMVWAWTHWYNRMISERERYYGLGMDALVTVCSWNTNIITSGHGLTGNRVILEHQR